MRSELDSLVFNLLQQSEEIFDAIGQEKTLIRVRFRVQRELQREVPKPVGWDSNPDKNNDVRIGIPTHN